mmetsp:Transcript_5233/g.15125  ORF Transcript_5233/g.15125 Transcript_5233/m.15125 type:complete len:297 (+) Transcript_5233:418-1308(+)
MPVLEEARGRFRRRRRARPALPPHPSQEPGGVGSAVGSGGRRRRGSGGERRPPASGVQASGFLLERRFLFFFFRLLLVLVLLLLRRRGRPDGRRQEPTSSPPRRGRIDTVRLDLQPHGNARLLHHGPAQLHALRRFVPVRRSRSRHARARPAQVSERGESPVRREGQPRGPAGSAMRGGGREDGPRRGGSPVEVGRDAHAALEAEGEAVDGNDEVSLERGRVGVFARRGVGHFGVGGLRLYRLARGGGEDMGSSRGGGGEGGSDRGQKMRGRDDELTRRTYAAASLHGRTTTGSAR